MTEEIVETNSRFSLDPVVEEEIIDEFELVEIDQNPVNEQPTLPVIQSPKSDSKNLSNDLNLDEPDQSLEGKLDDTSHIENRFLSQTSDEFKISPIKLKGPLLGSQSSSSSNDFNLIIKTKKINQLNESLIDENPEETLTNCERLVEGEKSLIDTMQEEHLGEEVDLDLSAQSAKKKNTKIVEKKGQQEISSAPQIEESMPNVIPSEETNGEFDTFENFQEKSLVEEAGKQEILSQESVSKVNIIDLLCDKREKSPTKLEESFKFSESFLQSDYSDLESISKTPKRLINLTMRNSLNEISPENPREIDYTTSNLNTQTIVLENTKKKNVIKRVLKSKERGSTVKKNDYKTRSKTRQTKKVEIDYDILMSPDTSADIKNPNIYDDVNFLQMTPKNMTTKRKMFSTSRRDRENNDDIFKKPRISKRFSITKSAEDKNTSLNLPKYTPLRRETPLTFHEELPESPATTGENELAKEVRKINSRLRDLDEKVGKILNILEKDHRS